MRFSLFARTAPHFGRQMTPRISVVRDTLRIPNILPNINGKCRRMPTSTADGWRSPAGCLATTRWLCRRLSRVMGSQRRRRMVARKPKVVRFRARLLAIIVIRTQNPLGWMQGLRTEVVRVGSTPLERDNNDLMITALESCV